MEYDPPHAIDVENGVTDIKFKSNYTSNEGDLLKTLNNHIEGKSTLFWHGVTLKGHASLKDEMEEHLISSDTFLVISVEGSFGRKTSEDIRLKKEYQELINKGAFEDFVRHCGTHYIGVEYRDVKVSALISAHGLTQSLKKKILRDIGLSVSGLSSSIEGKSTVDKLLQETRKYTSLSISFTANAGKGFVDLSNLIKVSHSADYAKIVEAIGNYVAGIDAAHTAPSAYEAISMTRFGLKLPPFNPEKSLYLQKAYAEYIHILSLEKKLEKWGANSSNGVSAHKLRLTQHKNFIERLGERCFVDNECRGTIPNLRNFSLDYMKNMEAKLSCSYIEASDRKIQLLNQVNIMLIGELQFLDSVDKNSIEIFVEEKGKEGLQGPLAFTFSFNPEYLSDRSQQFVLYHDTDPYFNAPYPRYITDNINIATKRYNEDIKKRYYVAVSDRIGNQFLYYLGTPEEACEISLHSK